MELITQIEIFVLGTIEALYHAWGWFGVAALLVFENATGITPSEIILGFAGWMLISEMQLSPALIFLGGLYAAIGSLVGASIAYWAARLGGRPLVERFARWLRIDTAHITRAETLFNRWGVGVVFIGRMMPGIRTLVSLPAGMARMPYGSFVVATFFGAYLWCTLLIGAGYLLGHQWELVSTYLKQALPYLLAGGAVALAGYLWFNRRANLRARLRLRMDQE